MRDFALGRASSRPLVGAAALGSWRSGGRSSAVGLPYDPLAIAALAAGSIALGGTDAAMLLGHWYSSQPKLSPGPLRRPRSSSCSASQCRFFLSAIVALRGDTDRHMGDGPVGRARARVGVGLFIAGLSLSQRGGRPDEPQSSRVCSMSPRLRVAERSRPRDLLLTGVPI